MRPRPINLINCIKNIIPHQQEVIVEIAKIAQTDHQEFYKIVTAFEVEEDELKSQSQVIELIKDDDFILAKADN